MERIPAKLTSGDTIPTPIKPPSHQEEFKGHVCVGSCYPPESGREDQLSLTTINRSIDSIDAGSLPISETVFERSK